MINELGYSETQCCFTVSYTHKQKQSKETHGGTLTLRRHRLAAGWASAGWTAAYRRWPLGKSPTWRELWIINKERKYIGRWLISAQHQYNHWSIQPTSGPTVDTQTCDVTCPLTQHLPTNVCSCFVNGEFTVSPRLINKWTFFCKVLRLKQTASIKRKWWSDSEGLARRPSARHVVEPGCRHCEEELMSGPCTGEGLFTSTTTRGPLLFAQKKRCSSVVEQSLSCHTEGGGRGGRGVSLLYWLYLKCITFI